MEGTQNLIYDLQLQTFTASAAGFLSYDCAMTFASTVCNGEKFELSLSPGRRLPDFFSVLINKVVVIAKSWQCQW